MKILTVGDSWTYGDNSSDPATMSWPAQMARKYKVEVTNLGQGGVSNHRACRIAVEELCRNDNYDYVIFPLGPANRTEILNHGKWQRVWPKEFNDPTSRLLAEIWHSWNDVQYTILQSFYFSQSLSSLGVPLYMCSLSFGSSKYAKEFSWIIDYQNDNNFEALDMPLDEFNIGIKDLDRKLKSLKAIHQKTLQKQPDYIFDAVENYMHLPEIKEKYGLTKKTFQGHPDDAGYGALADFFANKIGLTT